MHSQLRQFVFLLLLLLPWSARATHIVGGEMTYTCLGNDLYEVKLTIFRDCYNGEPWFDNPASIGIFHNVTNAYINQMLIPLDSMQNDTLDPDLGSECFVAPPDVCVHTTHYKTTVNLPFVQGGYYLVYQRCCRNHTITNLIAPEDVGATYGIVIGTQALQQCNSSPVFNDWPPLYLCVNQAFEIDQSATDSDGDSLVYKLCEPLHGANPLNPMPQPPNPPPYNAVPWLLPYHVNNQIGGLPAMAIDPMTGLLTGTPNTIGQFVIGICVDEYRNGALIGTNRRDYQVNIGECAVTTAAFFAPSIICDGLTLNLENQSQSADNFIWYFNDPSNPAATSSLVNPSYTYGDTGLYEIVLIAEPGTVCSDTFSTSVHLLNNSLFADFELADVDCEDSLTLRILDSSVDTISSIASWTWTLAQGSNTWNSNEQNPVFVLTEQGQALLTLVVLAENGCMDTLQQPFPVVFIDHESLLDTSAICLNEGFVQLNPDSLFLGASFSWTPSELLEDPTSVNPTVNPDTTTTYQVEITDATGFCKIEKTIVVLVSPVVSVSPVLDTIFKGESVPFLATYDPSFTYAWSPDIWLDGINSHDPISKPDADIAYTLTVTDSNGCVAVRTVTIIVLTLCDEPFVFIPTGFTPNGDQKNEVFKVFGNDLVEVRLLVYDRWGEKVFESTDPDIGWDGTHRGKMLPPDAYGFYAEVTCLGGSRFVKKGNVTLLR